MNVSLFFCFRDGGVMRSDRGCVCDRESVCVVSNFSSIFHQFSSHHCIRGPIHIHIELEREREYHCVRFIFR